jgi:hypothetical protein
MSSSLFATALTRFVVFPHSRTTCLKFYSVDSTTTVFYITNVLVIRKSGQDIFARFLLIKMEKPFTFWDFENDLQNDCHRFAMSSSVHASNGKPKSTVLPRNFSSHALLHSVIDTEATKPFAICYSNQLLDRRSPYCLVH